MLIRILPLLYWFLFNSSQSTNSLFGFILISVSESGIPLLKTRWYQHLPATLPFTRWPSSRRLCGVPQDFPPGVFEWRHPEIRLLGWFGWSSPQQVTRRNYHLHPGMICTVAELVLPSTEVVEDSIAPQSTPLYFSWCSRSSTQETPLALELP